MERGENSKGRRSGTTERGEVSPVERHRAPGKQTLTQGWGAADEAGVARQEAPGSIGSRGSAAQRAGDWVADEGLMSAMGLSLAADDHEPTNAGGGQLASPTSRSSAGLPLAARRPGQPVLVLHKRNEPPPSPQRLVRVSIGAQAMAATDVVHAVLVQAYGLPAARADEFDEYLIGIEPGDSPGVTVADAAAAAGVVVIGVSPALDELLRNTAAQMKAGDGPASGGKLPSPAAGAHADASATPPLHAEPTSDLPGPGALIIPPRLKEFFLTPVAAASPTIRTTMQQAIAELSALTDEDLTTFRLLGTHVARDPAKLLHSVQLYKQLKTQYQAVLDQALQEAAAEHSGKLPIDTSASSGAIDPATFKRWSSADKEQHAREQMSALRNQQLAELARNPGHTLKEMGKAILRPDLQLAEASHALHDASHARGGWEHSAKSAGAASKLSGVLAVMLGLLLIVSVASGVGVAALGEATLAMMFTSLSLSMVEKELYVKAAGAADTPEQHRAMIEAGAAADVRTLVGLAGLGATIAGTLIGRIPLPGRLQTIGDALHLARAAAAKNVGEAWRSLRTDAAIKLRTAARGLREQLSLEARAVTTAAGQLHGMTAETFFERLAADPALREALGIPHESASALAKLAKDPAAKADTQRFFDQLKAASAEGPALAKQQLDDLLTNLERHARAIETAATKEDFEAAAASAQDDLGDDAMTRLAAQGEQHTAEKVKELGQPNTKPPRNVGSTKFSSAPNSLELAAFRQCP